MVGKAARAIGSNLICIRLTERERESWTRGVRTEEKKKEKKTKTRGPNQCWKTVHDRWQTRVQLLFSPSFSPTLSLSFSLPLHFPSLTIDWVCANMQRAHLFGMESQTAQPIRTLPALKGREERWQREKQRGGGVDSWWLAEERGRGGGLCVVQAEGASLAK